MTMLLLKVIKRVTSYNEKEKFIAKDLMTPKYKIRVIKPKKGREVLKEKNN